jgi:hypothetical protein
LIGDELLVKTVSVAIALALLPVTLAEAQQQAIEPLTNQRIVQLTKSGLSADELSRVISTAPTVSFDLSPTGEQQMMQAGVTEGTIKAMAARESGASLQPELRPSSLTKPPARKHSHHVRTWVIVGVAAGGLAFLGYALS